MKQKSHVTIGLLGPYGFGNLGDTAIQQSMIANLRRRIPDLYLCGLSQNPEDTQERHNIPAFPIVPQMNKKKIPLVVNKVPLLRLIWRVVRRIPVEPSFIISSYLFLRKFDALIISGGGQLDDYWGGAFGHPYTLLKWGILAKLCHVKFLVVSVGAGPLDSSLSRLFTRWTLSLACFRSYRDVDSRDLIKRIGFDADDSVFPDLAFSLIQHGNNESENTESGIGVIGIGPMDYFHPISWPKQNEKAYQAYLEKLVNFAAWLIQNNYKVLLFPGVCGTDDNVIAEFKECLTKSHSEISHTNIIVPTITTVEDLTSQLGKVEIVVASRFHGILTAFLMNRPVIGLSYHNKDTVLMNDFGQSNYCLSIDDFAVENLKELFGEMVTKKNEIKKMIKSIVDDYRGQLDLQYQDIFEILEIQNSELSSSYLTL